MRAWVPLFFVLPLILSAFGEAAQTQRKTKNARKLAQVSREFQRKQLNKKVSSPAIPPSPATPKAPPAYVEAPAIPRPDAPAIEVDLSAPAPSETAQARRPVSTAPQLHLLFDLALTWRPGVTPLSFDNFHSFFLAEVVPTPESYVMAEVNPSPRFFEFGYQVHPRLQIRAGKIWIPFNGMVDTEPHSLAGGWYGTTRLFSTHPYLPDIWADLGLAIKWTLRDDTSVQSFLQLYGVNGLGSGGTDPLGQVATTGYPSFSTPTLGGDNNSDKALGGRWTALFSRRLGIGASFYTGRFTADSAADGRITLYGLDAQVRAGPLELRSGWMNMVVTLPAPASPASMSRPGFYVESLFRLLNHWKWIARYGNLNTDSRAENAGDRSIVGGVIAYDVGYYQISFEVFGDLQRTVDKAPSAFSALRFFVRL